MVKITAYLRPHKLEQVKMAIAELPITGISVVDARGRGRSEEQPVYFGGAAIQAALPIKSKLTVVVPEDIAEAVIQKIVDNARTGEPGDGKVFTERIEDAVRIRTMERGNSAV